MYFKLIVVGNVKESYYRSQIAALQNQINKHVKLNVIELKDESIPQNASTMEKMKVKEIEGTRILEQLENRDYVYALCIDGEMKTSEELREHIKRQASQINGNLVFLIGGSLGLADKVIKRANYKLSFSKLTFPHQLMRVMLLEQISMLK